MFFVFRVTLTIIENVIGKHVVKLHGRSDFLLEALVAPNYVCWKELDIIRQTRFPLTE